MFCSADEVPRTLAAWKHNGYSPSAVRIFDMFPGSPNVETMVLLEKTKKKKKHPAGRDSKKSAAFGKNARVGKSRNTEKSASHAKSNRAAKKAARGHAQKRKPNPKNAG